ncbi:hypothetical protein BKA64DRAFT_642258 [Cadophora sp. MPI-SDFR-AT-0126]|nr:hypothetical protein BKA64DRAFT_642258 [Leotiomycetes sp. MPI-SDFR-AT-0126]
MSTLPKTFTPQSFEEWLNGVFIGSPSEARAYCKATMSPNYLRLQAGGDSANFEQSVEKVTFLRANCKKWVAPVQMLIQEGRNVAVRMIVNWQVGDGEEEKAELMFMGERDEEGRFEKVWELVMPFQEGK